VKLAIPELGSDGKVQLFRLGHVARQILASDDALGIVEVAHMIGQDWNDSGNAEFDHVELLCSLSHVVQDLSDGAIHLVLK
jgi:hypothetical protein